MKKRLFKIFALIIAVLLSLSTLASCQSGGDNNGDSPSNTSDVPSGGDGKFSLPEKNISDETEYTEGVYKYLLYDDETAIILEHTGDESEIVIPDLLGGYPVYEIAPLAFYGNQNATKVTFGKNVEVIGSSAFNGCEKLIDVEIPEKIWRIYPDAFTDTPWLNSKTEEFLIVGDSVLLNYNGTKANVVIPDGVKHIADAFLGNEIIKSVVIPDSVYTIGYAAFSSSTLTRAELGNNVVLIDNSAFAYCYDLHYVNMPDSLKTIESYAFVSCVGLNYLKIGKNVERIAPYAFYKASQFSYLYLPKSVKTIGELAFQDCNFLQYVFYEGTEEEFDALGVSGYNVLLADAKKYYNYDYVGGTYETQ